LSDSNPDPGVNGGKSGKSCTRAGPQRATTLLPDKLVVQRVNRLLARNYRLKPADRQDVIADALLECLRAGGEVRRNINSFFIAVARRRACDFWRRKSREDRFATKVLPPNSGDDRNERTLLEEFVEKILAAKSAPKRRRAQKIVHGVLEGASFTEACRAAMIPRGSQGRYRAMLQQCLDDVLHVSRRTERLATGAETTVE
jgi:DNA-directed RNA polymerase specialized sigma24 family protein